MLKIIYAIYLVSYFWVVKYQVMNDIYLNNKIDEILKGVGSINPIVKPFIIGKINPLNAVILYIDGMTEKNIIDRDVLTPLMLCVNEAKYFNILRENKVKGIWLSKEVLRSL